MVQPTKGKKERVGRILQMHANKRQELDKVYAGDIAAAVGLKFTATGDSGIHGIPRTGYRAGNRT